MSNAIIVCWLNNHHEIFEDSSVLSVMMMMMMMRMTAMIIFNVSFKLAFFRSDKSKCLPFVHTTSKQIAFNSLARCWIILGVSFLFFFGRGSPSSIANINNGIVKNKQIDSNSSRKQIVMFSHIDKKVLKFLSNEKNTKLNNSFSYNQQKKMFTHGVFESSLNDCFTLKCMSGYPENYHNTK